MAEMKARGPGRSFFCGSWAAVLIAALCAGLAWIWVCRPVEVPEHWDKPLFSVSFAPFREGQSPLTRVYPGEAEVRQDLETLVGHARGIRTYTAREGLEKVPEMADALGLQVTLGAWLTSEIEEEGRRINRAEIDALIRAANRYPQAVDRVIVGNEVLLRNDLPPEKLIAYIRQVKAAVRQPVSYADVWAFYLRYPEVGREVDYITIHILPYWEDQPSSLEDSEAHLLTIVEKIRAAFPGKPILIGETGWPTLGRDRGPARVNTVTAARYIRKVARLADQHGFDYNVVEAFDQPWKAALENTPGAAWGIWDVERHLKFAMNGPVEEVPGWKLRAALSLGLGLLAGLMACRLPGKRSRPALRLGIALLAQALAALAVITCFHAEAVAFAAWEKGAAFFRGGMALAVAWLALARTAALIGKDGGKIRPLDGEGLMLLNAFYALIWTVLLIVDGRYRDIPAIDFGAAASGIAVLVLTGGLLAIRRREALLPALSAPGLFGPSVLLSPKAARALWHFLAFALPLAAAGALLAEGMAIRGDDFSAQYPGWPEQLPLVLRAMVANAENNLWAAMLLMLALPAVFSSLAARGAGKRAGAPADAPRQGAPPA